MIILSVPLKSLECNQLYNDISSTSNTKINLHVIMSRLLRKESGT